MSNAEKPAPPPRTGMRQLATCAALRTLIHRPRWFFRNLLQGPEAFLGKRRKTGIEPFSTYLKPEADAVAAVLGIDPGEYQRAVAKLWMPSADPDEPLAEWNARGELLRMIGAIVKLTQPQTVVETGVALGFTTATVLRAMCDNGEGHLYSIDLPALQYHTDAPIGRAVAEHLKDRWTLELGDSRELLDPIAAEAAPIDVFLHDALHTYSSQMREYRTVWPHLRSGGVLMSDDVDNPAFVEFAHSVGAEPHLVCTEGKPSAVALLRKP